MKMILALALCCLSYTLQAQQYNLPLWPDGVPNYKDVGEKEIIEGDGFRSLSFVQDPTIEVFLPSTGNSVRRAVLICPGGGYSHLAYDKEGTDIAKWLNGHGIAGIVLKYRLPRAKSNIVPHETPLMDAKQAMKMVKANAAEWNIDADKIGVMGFSAGGHLASTLGTHFDAESRPDFMVLMYPVISMKQGITHGGSKKNLIGENPTKELETNFSNELQVKKDTPPTFLVHTMDDTVVPVENSLMFYQALKNQNIPSEMHLYPYGGHGYALALSKGHLQSWKERLIDWMKSLDSEIASR